MKSDDELISEYLTAEATDDDIAQLFAWVREHPENASRFIAACSLHAQLRDSLKLPVNETNASKRNISSAETFSELLAVCNRFLIAASILLIFQMSWGAITMKEVVTQSSEILTSLDYPAIER